MSLFFSAAALVTLALLATSKRFYRVRRSRIGAGAVAGGWVAVSAGLLLGPFGTGAIAPDAVLSATPLLSVGLGWIGLMIGLQARRDILTRLPRVVWRLSLADFVASSLVTGALAWLAISSLRGSISETPLLAVALFAAAAIGWSSRPDPRPRRLDRIQPPRGSSPVWRFTLSCGRFFGVVRVCSPAQLHD